MSAPNKAYDPVEVAMLSPEELQRMQADALAAIASAASLDELKTARLAHFGDRAPLTLANAEIGALPPAARADAGKRVGAARAAIKTALASRQAELEADRAQGCQPFVVIASAGTANTGAIDDLAGIARFCGANDLWMHVDAAFGGLAMLTDEFRPQLEPIAVA